MEKKYIKINKQVDQEIGNVKRIIYFAYGGIITKKEDKLRCSAARYALNKDGSRKIYIHNNKKAYYIVELPIAFKSEYTEETFYQVGGWIVREKPGWNYTTQVLTQRKNLEKKDKRFIRFAILKEDTFTIITNLPKKVEEEFRPIIKTFKDRPLELSTPYKDLGKTNIYRLRRNNRVKLRILWERPVKDVAYSIFQNCLRDGYVIKCGTKAPIILDKEGMFFSVTDEQLSRKEIINIAKDLEESTLEDIKDFKRNESELQKWSELDDEEEGKILCWKRLQDPLMLEEINIRREVKRLKDKYEEKVEIDLKNFKKRLRTECEQIANNLSGANI